GLGEATIIQYVRINGVQHRLGVRDIIRLHESGVSEKIINAMQTAPVISSPVPVIVEPQTYPVDSRFPSENNRRMTTPRFDLPETSRTFGPSIIAPGIAEPEPLPAPARPHEPWDLAPARQQ
ncbi:MAG: hypothetical protein MI861_28830, partial [Pirellulales bacterium]|nr:hypothetical protein [Pirellulales bacterium]